MHGGRQDSPPPGVLDQAQRWLAAVSLIDADAQRRGAGPAPLVSAACNLKEFEGRPAHAAPLSIRGQGGWI